MYLILVFSFLVCSAAYTGYSDCNLDCMVVHAWWLVAVVLVVEVMVVVTLVGVALVALAHILEPHFVTCTVWWQ